MSNDISDSALNNYVLFQSVNYNWPYLYTSQLLYNALQYISHYDKPFLYTSVFFISDYSMVAIIIHPCYTQLHFVI